MDVICETKQSVIKQRTAYWPPLFQATKVGKYNCIMLSEVLS